MTALEAAASTRTREAIRAQAQVIDHARLSDRLVHDVLLGWPARADSRRMVLDAARVCGVDVATVPARSPAEVAAWLVKRRGAKDRPCPACVAKDAELAALRMQFCGCEAHMAELLDAERAEVAALRDRIAELDDTKAAAQAAVIRLQRELADARRDVPAPQPADPLPSEPVAHPVAALEPVPPATLDDVLPTCDRPRPAPRPRSRCKVRVLMPGEELAPDGTVTTPAEAAG